MRRRTVKSLTGRQVRCIFSLYEAFYKINTGWILYYLGCTRTLYIALYMCSTNIPSHAISTVYFTFFWSLPNKFLNRKHKFAGWPQRGATRLRTLWRAPDVHLSTCAEAYLTLAAHKSPSVRIKLWSEQHPLEISEQTVITVQAQVPSDSQLHIVVWWVRRSTMAGG